MTKTDEGEGEVICNRIRNNVSEYSSSDSDLFLSLSLGLATADSPDQDTPHDLVKKADDYMYRDKLYYRSSMSNQIVQASWRLCRSEILFLKDMLTGLSIYAAASE